MLRLHLLVFGKQSVCFTKIYADIPAHVSLNDTGNNISLFTIELVEQNRALLFSYLLKDNVLGIGCSNTSEFLAVDVNPDNIINLRILIDKKCICKCDLDRGIHYIIPGLNYRLLGAHSVITRLTVNRYLNVVRLAEVLLTCLDKRVLNSLKQRLLAYFLFLLECIKRLQ